MLTQLDGTRQTALLSISQYTAVRMVSSCNGICNITYKGQLCIEI